MNENKVEFLAIGDIVTDAFIRLKDADVYDRHKVNHVERQLCVRFGDKVPYESVTIIRAVGNSANAAISASRLGLSSALLSVVGDDDEGKKSLQVLKDNNVVTDYVTTDKDLPTNYHYVLWYGSERTILVKHSPFPRTIPDNMPPPKWVYLTSLGEDAEKFHFDIEAWLKQHPETKLAFQPGTFQIKIGAEKLKAIYELTEIFFCNKEEAEKILDVQSKDLLALSKGLRALGPKIVVISDGPDGAYMYAEEQLWRMPVYPDVAPPVDRTGAGDAFASTFVSALALGKTPLEAFTWAPINSMSVVQEVGAQKGLLYKEKLEGYLKSAPQNYEPEKMN
ncbi:MAG: carbohydrate kinase family protein [bacterium]|nr:carbohydrate kinase family protein [bacterium]